MNTIANKLICLNLNANWQPIGFKTVKDAIVDLCGGEVDGKSSSLALDIDYELLENGEPNLSAPKNMNPISWTEWLKLPIRVPTVIIAVNFNKMPVKSFRGKPSKDAIYTRDNGICQYTGKKIDRNSATVDHILPRSKGGEDSWANLVLCSRDINSKKGNRLNTEVGLKLIKQPSIPQPIPVSALIKEAKHKDWEHFLMGV
jgi:hypothetical protein